MTKPGDKETDIGGMADVVKRVSTDTRRDERVEEMIDETITEAYMVSNPPTGKDKITNIYYDPDSDEQVIKTQ